jgi:8-oxo-dGTP pyrophosphatase MutT (NUDIX family)
MNFEPEKFFIGLIDFFSILLPGALLVFLLRDAFEPAALSAPIRALGETGGYAAFLFASYLFVHFIFLVGKWLDEAYDFAKEYTLDKQIKTVAWRGRLLARPFRALIWLIFKDDRNLALNRARKIKRESLGKIAAADTINTFQWAKAFLALESPASLANVQRLEADSKFFRCFSVVLLVLMLTWPLHPLSGPTGLAIITLLFVLAIWRYMEQRFKSINQAYWSVITIVARDAAIPLNTPSPAPDAPTHAGGVVLRWHYGETQCLLVEATDDPTGLVLPKGHVEEDENPRETAVREVREETGVWARIETDLEVAKYSPKEGEVRVQYYLMRAISTGMAEDTRRRHFWVPLVKAKASVKHPETKHAIGLAMHKAKAAERANIRDG